MSLEESRRAVRLPKAFSQSAISSHSGQKEPAAVGLTADCCSLTPSSQEPPLRLASIVSAATDARQSDGGSFAPSFLLILTKLTFPLFPLGEWSVIVALCARRQRMER